MNDSKILLFVPAYNCEKQIERVLQQLNNQVLSYLDEVIVVNNLSSDSTEDKVLNYVEKYPEKKIKLLRNIENYGLGGSHKVAFNYALLNNFDFVIVLHGDDQGEIKDIIPILDKEDYKTFDTCLGSRFLKDSKLPGYSKFRIFGNKVFNFIFSSMLNFRVTDLGSGLNIYKCEILKSKFYLQFEDDLTFNCYMLLAADYYKHKVKFFPITWKEEDQVSNVKMFSQAFNTMKLLMEYRLNSSKYIVSELRKKPIDNYTHIEIK